ncbi:MAG: aminopeptidase P family protein [Clostridia bacterium]|nr:aminopeptidase P family protein [Clostridia bacterium]
MKTFESFHAAFPDLQGCVISHPADIFYLTGFFCPDALLLFSADPVLVTDSRYSVAAKQVSCRVKVFGGSYITGAAEEAKAQGLKALGVQENSLTAGDYLTLSEQGFALSPVGGFFTHLRARKTKEEVEKIRAAQAVSDRAFQAFLPCIKPGMTEKQLRNKLETLLFDCGADALAFETIVASGSNGAKPHAVPSEKPVQAGEFITFDFGARVGQYDSDMTRTVALGDVSAEQTRIYNAVLEAHETAMAALAPGKTGKEIDRIARDVLEKYDLAQYFTHSLGHGVGIDIHEEPNLSFRNDRPLEEGSIVTIEPGVYIEGFCGVRIENMAVLTRNGYDDLTATDKKLIKIPY